MINVEKTLDYVARNLRNGGVAIILTAMYLMAARPRNILVLLTPYSGDPVILGSVLVVIGVLSTTLGYALRRII